MWHDRWFSLGIIGTALSCLVCFTPAAVLALGAIGLWVWVGRLDTALLLLLPGFVALALYRYRVVRRRAS